MISEWGSIWLNSGPITVYGEITFYAASQFYGIVTLASDPVNPMEAATKQYADSHVAALEAKITKLMDRIAMLESRLK